MPEIKSGSISFSFNKEDLDWIKNKLKEVSPQKRDGVAEKGFTKLTLATEADLKNWSLRGAILNVRSGRLRQSIGSLVTRRGRDLVGTVGSGVRQGRRVPYANIHETGGVIKPKPSNPTGFLWIPIRSGSGFAISQGFGGKKTSFSSKVLGVIPVRSVTIPARHYLSRVVSRIEKQATQIMLREVDAELKKA